MENLVRRLKREYVVLVDAVSAAIDKADPIGLLAGGAPSDEYAPEIGTIVPRLKTANSADDVQRIIHEEFVRWFGDIAGRLDAYGEVGVNVWGALQAFRERAG